MWFQYGQNFMTCFEISWKSVLSYSFVRGRISWKQDISSKISWNQEISWKITSLISKLKTSFYFIIIFVYCRKKQTLSFEARECNSTPPHTWYGLKECDFHHILNW